MYEAITRDIRVSVETEYLEDRSSPAEDRHFWSYTISIENRGEATVQLLTRHWRITDERGHTIEVKGEGVVGRKPVLNPGQSFQYTSGTPLNAPSGFMTGSYAMQTMNGDVFDVEVPAFSLDLPEAVAVRH